MFRNTGQYITGHEYFKKWCETVEYADFLKAWVR